MCDTIDTDNFEFFKVEFLRNGGNVKIISDSNLLVPEKSRVITTYRNRNFRVKEVSYRVCPHIVDIAKNLVTYWTKFKTNLIFSYFLVEIRVFYKGKTVSYPWTLHKQRIIHIRVNFIIHTIFSSMENERYILLKLNFIVLLF